MQDISNILKRAADNVASSNKVEVEAHNKAYKEGAERLFSLKPTREEMIAAGIADANGNSNMQMGQAADKLIAYRKSKPSTVKTASTIALALGIDRFL